ncbi:MAG TPA: UDP-N-acetylmuramate dehydrogenase [Burkholderiales bacterium]|nr:UDP-N-acetylmuramate dehydrogenase [Burkholderiales bacterium]
MKMTEPIHKPAAALRGTLRLNEPMARHVSWRAGGPAARAYLPADTADLALFLRTLPAHEPVAFVGLGSNLLVRDGGYRGTVVLLHNTRAAVRLDEALVYAEAGVAAPKVARFAGTHALEGAEFLAGIPGTVGGALAMNAGCYGSETWDIVARVRTVSRSGDLRERGRDQFDVGYRHVELRGARLAEDEWFVAGWFALRAGDGARARARVKHLLGRRIATQPLGLPNAGSVFRNPLGDHAARLIEACGLKGFAVGGARISEKHANFIVNPEGGARAADIERLIEHARAEVMRRQGIDLLPEVRIIGDPK